MQKLSNDTHSYDRIIGPLYSKYLIIDNKELHNPDSFDSVISEITNQINKLNNNIKKISALKSIELLTNNTNSNYDKENHIDAQDLLKRTWRFVKHYDQDGIECFIEQLSDIMNGSCSQGRTTRIFQFYEFHMVTKDEIYDKVKII